MNHFYEKLFGWTDHLIEVYAEAVANAPADRHSVFVEIGAWMGKSTSFMAVEIINSGKPIAFHVVDHWRGSTEDETQKTYLKDHGPGSARWQFDRNMADVLDRLTIHDCGSPEAAGHFADESVDFCYIDGDHSEAAVRADIAAWLPKVRKGGVLAGHDYNYESVKKVVDEFFPNSGPHQFSWKVVNK